MTEALDRAVQAHATHAFAFLADLVSAASVVGTEQGALEVFGHELASLGMTVDRLPFSGGVVADPRAGVTQADAGSGQDRFQVLATTPGDGPLTCCSTATWTWCPPARPTSGPRRPSSLSVRDGRLYGRGAADMKGGFAVGAAGAARAAGRTPPTSSPGAGWGSSRWSRRSAPATARSPR